MGESPTQVVGGVETLTMSHVEPGAHLEVVDGAGTPIVTLVADAEGNAHLAFVPPEHRVLDGPDELLAALATGHTLRPGAYSVIDRSTTPATTHGPVTVLGVDDHPDESLFEQELPEGFGYVTVRDGVKLSVMVRFPNESLYGPGPWPTVMEYSGYDPSNPDAPQPGCLLANLLGFATVGVNMRGTGCSGGVFDVFSPAQAADGYDVIETIARQPWVLHGRPGMVGLSYPGISQLYVAATRPPHLAAITPLSVIDDLWRQQWPGGTYNSGFTRAWMALRDEQTQFGGMAWDQARIDAGDEVARENQQIRSQNFDFERFGRAMDVYQESVGARNVGAMVQRIDVPVYLTGAWQDEQTGSRFALMVESFTSSPHTRFNLFNGHHPDGYSPMVILRWFEFLSFHVAKRVPQVPEVIRMFAPAQFADVFGYATDLEADRFAQHGDDYPAALADYLAEPRVRLLFESGAGHEVPGATAHRYEVEVDSFPPPGVVAHTWWLADDGLLAGVAPASEGADRYADDLDAGEDTYAKDLLSDLQRFTKPDVPISWSRFDDAHRVAYETGPLDASLTIAGQGHLDLWLQPGTTDTAVQVAITEVLPDGHEQRVQCGWHRPTHRVELAGHSDELRVDYTFVAEDRAPLVPGEWINFRLPIYPVTHVFRPGSRLRIAVSTPGRDHPFWCFDNPVEAGASHLVGRGGGHTSKLVLPVWPQGVDHPDEPPTLGSLRGQPVRSAAPIHNTAA